jgi:hypothetical protein
MAMMMMLDSKFRRHVNDILALLGCYAALISSYRRFETTYRSHFQNYFGLIFP